MEREGQRRRTLQTGEGLMGFGEGRVKRSLKLLTLGTRKIMVQNRKREQGETFG